MTTVMSVYEAKNQFSALLSRVEAGEDVVIARHGQPIVRLVALPPRGDRILGAAADRLWVDEDFDQTADDEQDAWYSSAIEPV